jgi:hypothetical protein
VTNLQTEGRDAHVGTLPASGQEPWFISERAHRSFDRLSKVSPENRKRTDLLRPEIFRFLENQVKECDDIKKYVNKFIAHAAAPETRSDLTENQKAITVERLETSRRIIYQVASFILGPLLWESNLGGLRVPQYDHLENLEKSWVSSKNLARAYQKWDEVAKEVSNWDKSSLWPPGFENH